MALIATFISGLIVGAGMWFGTVFLICERKPKTFRKELSRFRNWWDFGVTMAIVYAVLGIVSACWFSTHILHQPWPR